jgi:hypothetical protein
LCWGGWEMLSLAGIPLLAPDKSHKEWIRANIPVSQATGYLERAWPGSLLSTRGVAFRSRPSLPREVMINRFRWPEGADRFFLAFVLASANQVNQIEPLANGDDGNSTTPITLAMNNPESLETFETQVTLLKIAPLSQIPVQGNNFNNNFYILTIVDMRYYWQFTPCPAWTTPIPFYGASISISMGGLGLPVPTWQSLINDCASALDVTITNSTIPTAYLSPDPSLNLAGAPIGLVLQAIADNLGFRFVAKLDGTFAMQNYTDAQAAALLDSQVNPDRTIRAGGQLFQDVF